jgi:hypothetical protein
MLVSGEYGVHSTPIILFTVESLITKKYLEGERTGCNDRAVAKFDKVLQVA